MMAWITNVKTLKTAVGESGRRASKARMGSGPIASRTFIPPKRSAR